jgi:hypothetical protein
MYPYYMIHKDFQVAFEEGKYERLYEFKGVYPSYLGKIFWGVWK